MVEKQQNRTTVIKTFHFQGASDAPSVRGKQTNWNEIYTGSKILINFKLNTYSLLHLGH